MSTDENDEHFCGEWVIEGQLARCHRPGRRHPSYGSGPVPIKIVEEWVGKVRNLGIRSIICLLRDCQLKLYAEVVGGSLVDYYRTAGFEVAHVPSTNHEPLSPTNLDNVWREFQRLPKPVLVHCSYGNTRSRSATEHIVACLNGHLEARG